MNIQSIYDRGYVQGKAAAFEDVKRKVGSFHVNMIERYGANTVEARADAFDELNDWLKEQKYEL